MVDAVASSASDEPENTPEPLNPGEYSPPQVADLLRLKSNAPDSQAALAERAVKTFGDDLRYCKGLGWLHWNGRFWERDDKDGSRTAKLFTTLSESIKNEAARLYTLAAGLAQSGRAIPAAAMAKAAKAHLRHVKQVETESFAQGAMVLARSPLTVSPDVFLPKAWRIGFDNGVWDKGVWREHRRDDYALAVSRVAVGRIGETTADFRAYIERVTGGDADFERTLQEVAGYALSGSPHLRLLLWLYGEKGTGKSTFAELLLSVLGCGDTGGAATVKPSALKDDADRARLGASLYGKRLAVCSEAGNQKVDAEALKTLSGGDSLTVRFLYQEEFTARASHVLFMVANDAPNTDAYDDALRDRVKALPFVHRLAEPAPLALTGHSRIEAAREDVGGDLVKGFAAWSLDGAARVYKTQAVHFADVVNAHTAKFWQDADPLTQFWQTVNRAELEAGMTRADLRKKYEDWCAASGLRRLSPQRFAQACRSIGLVDSQNHEGKRTWRSDSQERLFDESAYTAYTSDPNSAKVPIQLENKSLEGFSENTLKSVCSVCADTSAPEGEIIPL